MRINIDGQCMADANFRGVPYYTQNLINRLAELGNNEYSLSFFDLNGERGNRELIYSHLNKFARNKIQLEECTSESYKMILDNAYIGVNESLMPSYEDYFNGKAELYHFPHSALLGMHIPECSVVTVHDVMPIVFKGKGYWSERAEKQFINSQNYLKQRKDIIVLADSESTKCNLVNCVGIEEERIRVVYASYDEENCYEEYDEKVLSKFNIHGQYIMYIGALDARKGIFDLINAFELIAEKHKDLSLVLAGKTDVNFENEISRYKNLKCLDRIIFTGYVSDREKRILLSSAKMFVFPSEYEGFGIPVLEAMACGCPVITTNVSSLPEVGGDAALYVRTNNAVEIAERIEEVLEIDCSAIKRKMQENIARFSWNKTALEIEKIYEEMI